MTTSSAAILGGGLHHCYAGEYLLSLGWSITYYKPLDFPYSTEIHKTDSLIDALENASLVLFSEPLSNDILKLLPPALTLVGCNVSPNTVTQLSEKNIVVYDVMSSLEFVREHTILTTEGLLSQLIYTTPFSLSHANLLLLGFGRYGAAIGNALQPLFKSISVIEENEHNKKQAQEAGFHVLSSLEFPFSLPQYQIIVNTVSASIFPLHYLPLLPKDCLIYDISPAPFDFPVTVTAEYSYPCYHLTNLWENFNPKTAGHILARAIERMSLISS
ncbi:MAG: hypothetical protein RSF88_05090 [Lachnospiraceae bacterium]